MFELIQLHDIISTIILTGMKKYSNLQFRPFHNNPIIVCKIKLSELDICLEKDLRFGFQISVYSSPVHKWTIRLYNENNVIKYAFYIIDIYHIEATANITEGEFYRYINRNSSLSEFEIALNQLLIEII